MIIKLIGFSSFILVVTAIVSLWTDHVKYPPDPSFNHMQVNKPLECFKPEEKEPTPPTRLNFETLA